MRRAWWLLLALLAGCSKCGAGAVPDSGYGAGCSQCAEAFGAADAGFSARHAIDLRTALMFAYPENRGASMLAGSAMLTRHVRAPIDWVAEVQKTYAKSGFVVLDGGYVGGEDDAGVVLAAKRSSQHLDLVRVTGDEAELRTWVHLNDEVVAKVFGAPSSMSTQEMALVFPRGAQLYVADERFDLEFVYQAMTPQRTAFMTKQVLELLERSGQWQFVEPRPWEGDGGVPEEFTTSIRNSADGATLHMIRRGVRAQVKLTLQTLVR